MNLIKKHFRTILKVLAVVLVILLIRWYVNRDGLTPVPVRNIEISDRIVERTVSTTGLVKAKKEAELSFFSVGRVLQLDVSKGDPVEKGKLLAHLDTSSLGQTIQALKDARDIVIRERELFIETYESKKSEYGGDDEYNIRLRQLDESVSQAEASYLAGLYSTSSSYIYAPFDGVVIDTYKEVGETALAGTTIVKIADLDQIYFEINLDQEDYGLVKLGMRVEVNLDAYDDVEFIGEIVQLPFYANGGSSTNFTVKITIDETDGYKPLIGMTGDAHIVIESSESQVPSLVYDEIFIDDDDREYVWTNKDGYLSKEFIEVGLEGDIYTQILTALDEEIVLPIDDTQDIKEGYKAKLVR